jgi:hypothetical protein
LGQYVEHLVCSPKSKGLATLLKINSNPLQSTKTQHRIKGRNPRVDLCPLIEQKIKRNWGFFWRSWVSGFVGKKWGLKGILVAGGGFGWWRTADSGVLVVGKVAFGGGFGWFWI